MRQPFLVKMYLKHVLFRNDHFFGSYQVRQFLENQLCNDDNQMKTIVSSLEFFDNSCMQHERKTQCERARKNGPENCVFFCLCFLFEVTYILERMWLSKWRQENSTTDTQLRKPSMAEDLVAAQIQSYISNQSQYATKKRFSFDVACISHVCSLNAFWNIFYLFTCCKVQSDMIK